VEVRSVEEEGLEVCLEAAGRCLTEGGVVCFPTETFYALGVLYDNEDGLRRVVDIKGRPPSKAFSLIIGDRACLEMLVEKLGTLERGIAESLWPSPLTVVFRAKNGLSSFITDEDGTVAVRIPAPSFALDLAVRVGMPITATSANPSGMSPARSAADVREYFIEGIDMLIDGGESSARYPSTIIRVDGDNVKVLREGAVSASELFRAVKALME